MNKKRNDANLSCFSVVINEEDQYSIWPVERDLPPGWRGAGKTGSREECLAFIDEVWVDMRPRSARKSTLRS